MWGEFLLTLFGLMTAAAAPMAVAILAVQRFARWDADRVISGRKQANVRELDQLIDVLMWFKAHLKEADRDRIKRLRYLKRQIS